MPVQTAQTTIDPDRSFVRPSATRPTPPPPARTGDETPRGATQREQIALLQIALGVPGDGYLGNQTRTAIREFQRGLNRRAPLTWKSTDSTGSLIDLLPKLSPFPPIFKSPFERAFFGAPTENTPPEKQYVMVDPRQLNAFLAELGPLEDKQWPAGNTEADLAEKLNLMRMRLGGLTNAGGPVPLTSAIYDMVADGRSLPRP